MGTRGAFVVWLMMMGTAPVGVDDVPVSSCSVPPVWRAQGQGWHWELGHCHCRGHSPLLEVVQRGWQPKILS